MSNNNILVIDDNRTTLDILRTILESEGFCVSYCENGRSALDRVKTDCFKIIVTDYRMSDMNGDDVTRLLRPLCPDAFIIGFSLELKDHAFFSAGADAFVFKHELVHQLIPLIKDRTEN